MFNKHGYSDANSLDVPHAGTGHPANVSWFAKTLFSRAPGPAWPLVSLLPFVWVGKCCLKSSPIARACGVVPDQDGVALSSVIPRHAPFGCRAPGMPHSVAALPACPIRLPRRLIAAASGFDN